MALSVATLTSTTYRHAVALSYRHLYKTVLRTIRYSVPSRYVLRGVLRAAFRAGSPRDFDPQRIVNTIAFLDRAGSPGTMERKILKSMTMVRYWQQPGIAGVPPLFYYRVGLDWDLLKIPNKHYNRVLHLLNESLGLCLR
ncbi:hypothetical protein VTO42DRAFT_4871 [Malbranchea cinnamomea]